MIADRKTKNMYGFLIDVSSSMEISFQDMQKYANNNRQKYSKKYESSLGISLFNTLKSIMKNDICESDLICTIGFGGQKHKVFDIVQLVARQTLTNRTAEDLNKLIKKILNFIKQNGVPYIENWALPEELISELSYAEARAIYLKFKKDKEFCTKFINQLPSQCKSFLSNALAAFVITAIQNGGSDEEINKAADKYYFAIVLPKVAVSLLFWPFALLAGGLIGLNTAYSSKDEIAKQIKDTLQKRKLTIKQKIRQLRDLIEKPNLQFKIDQIKLYTKQEVSKYLEQVDFDETDQNLNKKIELHLFGKDTPLTEGLTSVANIFKDQKFNDYQKTLILVTDGDPNSRNNQNILEFMKNRNVKICVVWIEPLLKEQSQLESEMDKTLRKSLSQQSPQKQFQQFSDQLQIYKDFNQSWSQDKKYAFSLSSRINVKQFDEYHFIKREWRSYDKRTKNKQMKKIAKKPNQFNWKTDEHLNLFFIMNHPQTLEQIIEMLQDLYCNQDIYLKNMLKNIAGFQFYKQSLGLKYITEEEYKKDKQKNKMAPHYKIFDQGSNETCTACSCAVALYLTMIQVKNREGGIPSFEEIYKKILELFPRSDKKYPSGQEILRKMVGIDIYRLGTKTCQNIQAVKRAIYQGRGVIATLEYTDPEKVQMQQFFQNPKNKNKILTKKIIDITKRKSQDETKKHSITLIGYNSKSLKFLNSYGSTWGSDGTFQIEEGVFPFKFYQVFQQLDLQAVINHYITNKKVSSI